jgi:pilus assembly protein CpaF
VSLLRRIEQGQAGQQQAAASGGASGAGTATSTATAGGTTRVSPPIVRRPIPPMREQGGLAELKTRVQNKLLAELDPTVDPSQTAEIRRTIEELFKDILLQENLHITRAEQSRLFEQIVAEILGLGPIEPLLADETVTEIMVNGAKNIYIERKGKIHRESAVFESDDHLMRIIDRIVAPLGRRIDESSPYVDARLPDGSRVNAIIPPICLVGPTLTIRKFAKIPITVEQLIEYGTATPEAIEFLKACVLARINIVISGGTGSGKTTFLNVLSQYIPGDERIITIENAAELQLRQEHVVTLESRPPNIEGRGEVTIQNLVVNALRMRPDRIIVGEIRAAEALDMLQAMNTGHEGSMTTAHSNSPRDTLSRIETMTLMAGMDLPIRAIREQISSALELVVHLERLRDGSRKITHVTEIVGMEGDVITMMDIFVFEQTGFEEGRVVGRLRPTGLRPKFMEKIEASGIHLPAAIFGVGDRMRF